MKRDKDKELRTNATSDYELVIEIINALKSRDYTSPKDYGLLLAYRPRHKHAKGKRVLHVHNYPRKGIPYGVIM